MPSTQNSKPEKKYDFTPVEGYDASTIEPDAAPGEYEAKIEAVKIAPTQKDKFPMVIVEWKLLSTDEDDEACRNSVKATVADFIVFYPPGHRAAKMGKIKVRAICQLLEIDLDTIPSAIRSAADLEDFQRALKGQTATVYVTNKEDKDSGEIRVNIAYTKPRGMGGAPAANDDEDDAEPTPPKKGGKSKTTRR